ncbi:MULTISPECIES: HdeD family acid-resistance protein [Myroides]|uniref:HdeD family acid-resistance protein n=1 Tax=Myroides TaxID=76831 RepID=UPI0013032456|nr:HdeD family acid-resistance protein [Myroides phaeus]
MTNSFVKTVKDRVKNWYIPAIVGALFVVGGIYIFMTPLASYFSLTVLFSCMFLISGIFEIAFAFSNRDQLDGWGWMLFSGIVDLILGTILIGNPSLSAVVLPIFVGFGLMFRSMRGMGIAFDLKNYGVKSWTGLFVFALLGMIFAFFMLWNLEFGAFTIVYWTAFSFILLGIYGIMYGFFLRRIKKHAGEIDQELVDKYEAIKEEMRKRLHGDR